MIHDGPLSDVAMDEDGRVVPRSDAPISPTIIRGVESLFGPMPTMVKPHVVDRCFQCTIDACENIGGELTLNDLWSCFYPPVVSDVCRICGKAMT